jgi:hypothetical protein
MRALATVMLEQTCAKLLHTEDLPKVHAQSELAANKHGRLYGNSATHSKNNLCLCYGGLNSCAASGQQ